MTRDKIDELAKRFSMNCGIASERYDEPKYVFAALLTMVEYLDEVRKAEKLERLQKAQAKAEREIRKICGRHRG